MHKLYQFIFKLFIIFILITTNVNTYSKSPSDKTIATKLHTKLMSLSKNGDFAGSIILAKYGKPFMQRAYGYADRNNKVKNTLNTRFNLASLGKLFTVISIAQLIEQGKIELNTKVETIVPDWLHQDAKNITIQQLMQHTSGLSSYFDNEKYLAGNYQKKFLTVKSFKPIIKNQKPEFKPGSQGLYSNSAYILLGAVIEKVSQQSYESYITKNILKPTHMNQSDLKSKDQYIPNMSVGYFKEDNDKQWLNNNYLVAMKPSPAGGVHASAKDIFKLSNALAYGDLLQPETTHQMLKGKLSPHKIYNWYITPYGLEVSREDPYCVGKGGFMAGNSTQLDWYPESGYQVIILSNSYLGSRLAIDALSKIAPNKFRLQ